MTFLVTATLRISIILSAGLFSLRLMRRTSAAVRHWTLSVAVLFAAASPLFTVAPPAWPLRLAAGAPLVVTASESNVSASTLPLPNFADRQNVIRKDRQWAPAVTVGIWTIGVT